MKVMVDDVIFCLTKGGIGRVWLETMRTISKRGFDKESSLEILILNRTGALQNLGFIEIAFPPHDSSNAHAERILIDKVVEHYEVDVFISSYYTWTARAVNLGVFYDFIPEVYGFEKINEHWQQRIIYCHVVDGIFSISQSTMNDGIQYYKRFEKLKKLVSLPGSSHAIKHFPNPNSTPFVPAKNLGKVSAGKPFMLTVGLGLAEYKNRKLIEQIVTSVDCPVNFLTIGGVELDPAIVKLAGALGTQVVHLDKVDDRELFAWGANSAGLLFPSLYEGFGLPVAEFVQLGIPVITTACGSLTEAANGDTIFISGEDPIEAIAAINRVVRDKPLTKKSQNRIPPNTWDGFADDLLRFAKALGSLDRNRHTISLIEDSILASSKIPN
jgi:glycosyltransferase involved in cell wall biosynthesis